MQPGLIRRVVRTPSLALTPTLPLVRTPTLGSIPTLALSPNRPLTRRVMVPQILGYGNKKGFFSDGEQSVERSEQLAVSSQQ